MARDIAFMIPAFFLHQHNYFIHVEYFLVEWVGIRYCVSMNRSYFLPLICFCIHHPQYQHIMYFAATHTHNGHRNAYLSNPVLVHTPTLTNNLYYIVFFECEFISICCIIVIKCFALGKRWFRSWRRFTCLWWRTNSIV